MDAEETYRMYQKNCAVIHFLVSCLKNEPNAYKFNALIENLMNEHNQKNNTEFKNVGEYIQNLKREHDKITDMMDSELRKAHKHSLK